MMSWATAVEGDVSVNLGFGGLRVDLDFMVGRQGLLDIRAGRHSLVFDREGLLGAVFLMMLLIRSLNWNVFVFMVFLELLWRELPQGGDVHCGRDIRRSGKVTHLAVFFKPPGLGEMGVVRASMCKCAARLGILTPGSLSTLM